jgi:TolB protein
VVILDIQSGHEIGVVEGASPVWSPDGSRIAVLRGIDNTIIIVDTRTMDEQEYAVAGYSEWAPAWSPEGALIAYTSIEAGVDTWNVEIRFGAVTGDSPAETSRLVADGFGTSWSPDGKHMAFIRYFEGDSGSGLAEILVADVFGGGHETRLTTDDIHDGYREGSKNPVWSPDGTRIAFTSDRPPEGRLVTARVDGTEREVLSRIGAHDSWITWSPDRSRVAFARYKSARGSQSDIYVMDRNGSNLRQVSSPSNGESWRPRWSPTGNKLLFASSFRHHPYDGIYVVNHDGSGERVLAADDPTPAGNRETFVSVGAAEWSPDETRIAFTRFVGTFSDVGAATFTPEVLVVEVDSGRRWTIFESDKQQSSPKRTRPSWSPDGSTLAFEHDGRLLVAAADGSALYELGTAPSAYWNIRWTPDGRSFVHRIDGLDKDGLSLSADGGRERRILYDKWSPANPQWSPDGSYLLFEDAGSIGVVSVDGEFLGWIPSDSYNNVHRPIWLDN